MPSNLSLRINTLGQIFISKNRKVSHPWRGGKAVVAVLVLITAGVLMISLFSGWADFQYISQSYQISQDQETQKQLLDMNRKLRIELANLSAISRLEKLAADYGMGAPLPSQVVTLP